MKRSVHECGWLYPEHLREASERGDLGLPEPVPVAPQRHRTDPCESGYLGGSDASGQDHVVNSPAWSFHRQKDSRRQESFKVRKIPSEDS